MENIIYLIYGCFGVMAIALVGELVHCFVIRMRLVWHNLYTKKRGAADEEDKKLSVSVIVYAKNDDDNMESFLPLVLEQEYEDFEIIVVDDASWDNTNDVIKKFQETYPFLRTTHVPEGTQVISHKKLALTLGAKAAKKDLLIFTDADCRPFSRHWIEDITKSFKHQTEFVIGYTSAFDDKKCLNHWIAFDTLMENTEALGWALAGKPITGFGSNIAYRKDTFFRYKGFAGFLHKEAGEDELMINAYSNSVNTAVQSGKMAHVVAVRKFNYREWKYTKMKQYSAERDFKAGTKAILAIEPICKWLFLLTAAAVIALAAIFMPERWIEMIELTAGAMSLRLIIVTLAVNLVARQYKQPAFWLGMIFFDLIHPFFKLSWKITSLLKKL